MRWKTTLCSASPALPVLAVLALVASLASCGGGSGPGGGTGGSGVTVVSGPVTAFGSVFVNGVELETPDGVPVTLDGRPSGLDALDVGMRVRVVGALGGDGLTGQAERIEAANELKGPVTTVLNPDTGTLGVLDQAVRLTDTTVFTDLPAGPGSLTLGELTEVSGFRAADGSFRATRVRRTAAGFGDLPEAELKVKGTVSSLSPENQTFALGTLLVDYAQATLDPSVAAAGGLADGLVLEVRSDRDLVGGVLVASTIEVEGPELEHGVEVRMKGIVTAFASATDFAVDGHPVTATAQTQFRRGTADHLAVGRVVEVEGEVSDQGVLVAREISFELAKTVKLQGEVSAKPAGSATVLGVTVRVDASTVLRDKRDGLSPFGLTQLEVGDRVDVRAFLDGGVAVAARLERDDFRPDGRVILQGPASVEGSVLAVLGAAVDTADFPTMEFVAADGVTPMTAAELLVEAGLPGNLVKLRGTRTGDAVAWQRAEIEVEHHFANEPGVNEFRFEVSAD